MNAQEIFWQSLRKLKLKEKRKKKTQMRGWDDVFNSGGVNFSHNNNNNGTIIIFLIVSIRIQSNKYFF